MRVFQRIHRKLNWSVKRYMMVIALILLITYVASAIFQTYKSIPEGLDFAGQMRASNVEFLADRSFVDSSGQRQHEQQIFDAMLTLIDQAQSTIVLDMFLFNAELGESKMQHRPLTVQLTKALIDKKKINPRMQIVLITDPINTVYGGVRPEHLHQLENAGIKVVVTDLRPLRASNPAWSGLWYMCCQSLGNNTETGWLPNPFGAQKITLRSYLALANFKANHRKTMVVDTLTGWKTLISSANPHDASSEHSNAAMIIHGKIASEVLATEATVAKMSQGDVPALIMGENKVTGDAPQVQLLTEAQIYDHVLKSINATASGEQLDLMMFYLSERHIVKALIAAKQRGVKVNVLLDPNKDAFGMQKNGIPNRQVAWELHKNDVPVRWCNTQGEQCHSKLLVITKQDQTKQVILGSANYTARNLKNYNLETNVAVTGQASYPAIASAQQYFDQAWQNQNGQVMSVDYDQYKDESWLKYWLYRFMEWSGLSTF
ncbi:MAG: phospholipase D family protein [Pseudomonadota bacterium]|nr:phospholipase D family protein [Pseudomonadota bacterium]